MKGSSLKMGVYGSMFLIVGQLQVTRVVLRLISIMLVLGYNYLAFDIIGDLAFGTPFGMVEAGRDSAPVLALGDTPDKVQYLPAVQILNDRGDFSASLGVKEIGAHSWPPTA